MAKKVSRRKLANYIAEQLLDGQSPQAAMAKVAAELVDEGRTRDWELVVADIEAALARRGYTVATITSAHPLDEVVRRQVTDSIAENNLSLREIIDPSVIGGIRVEIPGKRMDATIKHRLAELRAQKI